MPAPAPTAPRAVERRRRRGLRVAWRLAFGLLFAAWTVLLLAWLTLHWGILPRVEQWRPQIEERAGRALGVPVTIGAIHVRTSGWVPTLELSDVVLHDAQRREALRLPRVNAALSARSLLAFELRFEQLHIEGAQLDARRDTAGRLFVAGIELSSGKGADAESNAGDWLFSQHELAIRNGRLRWVDEQRGGLALELDKVDLVLRNGLRRHDLRLDATPPAAWGERFTLQARLTQPLLGRRGDWRRWNGTMHLSLPHADLAEVHRHVTLPVALGSGEGALRAWVDIRQGEFQAVTADLALRSVALRLGAMVEEMAFAQVQGRVTVEDGPTQLRLAAQGLAFVTADGVQWPRSTATLTLRHALPSPAPGLSASAPASRAFAGGELSADRLDLAVLAQLALRVPTAAWLAKPLAELAPTGQVSGLTAGWEGSIDEPVRYKVKASVTGLGVAALASTEADGAGRPGWRNAALEFEASEAGGSARLGLDGGALLLPGVFEAPEVSFDKFSTRLAWRIRAAPTPDQPAAVALSLTDTRFANADVQGELSAANWSSGSGPAGRLPGRIDLAGSLSRGRATAVARYLPLQLDASARSYVQQAVVGGRITSASFRVKGDLADFPFAPRSPVAAGAEGEFRISARAEDVSLVYVPGPDGAPPAWPAFGQVSGEIAFDRSAMEIRNARAKVFGVELTKVNGGIPDLAAPVLRLAGQGRGPLADLLRYVNATPIGGWIGHALREARAEGPADLSLALQIPIDAVDRAAVQGRVMLAGNDLRVTPALPLLAQAKARIDFTQKGFTVAAGSARTLGGEASFEGGQQGDGSLRFSVNGQATAEGLRKAPELGALSALASTMSGQASYRLALGGTRGQTELSLTSTLAGLALDLPVPFSKSADVAWPLRLEIRPEPRAAGEGSVRDSLHIELGNVLQAHYQRDLSGAKVQVLRGAVGVLEALPPLPERGVRALLNLPVLDGDAWQAVAERLQSAGDGRAGDGDAYLPRTVALRAGTFTSSGRRLTRLVAGVSQDSGDGSWRGNLDAEQVNGYIEVRASQGPASPGRVHARLSRLALPPADVESVESLLVQAPATVPALDVVIEDFELRGKKLGRVEIEAVNRANDAGQREWRLGRFSVSNPEALLSGTGQWQGAGVGRQRMVMDFKLDLSDSGAFLERLGMGGTLRGGKGRLAGQLSWSGSPLSLHVPSLDGRINVSLEAGQFLKVGGTGAGRLLSVLSLQSLPRRLMLDFRDVFQEGFAFDLFSGDVSIDDGVARTNNLRMRGVQAAVLMEGSADVGRETQDLRVLVVPEINAGTASLAYAVINPAVGLGSFLAQVFLRKPLMAASTREFTVQGTWADPKVERVERRFDAPLPDTEIPAAPAAAASKAAS